MMKEILLRKIDSLIADKHFIIQQANRDTEEHGKWQDSYQYLLMQKDDKINRLIKEYEESQVK